MTEEKQKKSPTQKNEGEGNRTAARNFNEKQQAFAKSGKVEEKAQEARRAVDSAEGEELRQAELIGKRHAADEDPEIKR